MIRFRLAVTAVFLVGAGCQSLPEGMPLDQDGPARVPDLPATIDDSLPATVQPRAAASLSDSSDHRTDAHVRLAAHTDAAARQEERDRPSPSAAADETESPHGNQDLSLADLELAALARNPTLAEAEAHIEALESKWLQVGMRPNMIVGYSGQQLGSGGEAEQNGLLIQHEWIRGSKLALNRSVVEQEIAIAEQKYEAQRRRVLTDVRMGYYEVLVAQERIAVTEQLVEFAQNSIGAAEALLRAGEVSQADVLRARIELQSHEIMLKTARSQHAESWSRLTAVLGDPELPARTLTGELHPATMELTWEDVLARVLEESPEWQAVLLDAERSRWSVERARAEGIQDMTFQGVVQYDNATRGSNAIVQVTMPLPLWNWNQGGIQQAQAEQRAAELAVNRVELSLQRRMASVFQRYSSARSQVEDYSKEEGMLDNVRSTLEFVQKAYQAGQIGYLDLLSVQRTYAQTNLAYLEAIGQMWAAIAEMEGLLLKDSLESTDLETR